MEALAQCTKNEKAGNFAHSAPGRRDSIFATKLHLLAEDVLAGAAMHAAHAP
jgi:hypothetical protein